MYVHTYIRGSTPKYIWHLSGIVCDFFDVNGPEKKPTFIRI